MQAVYKIMDAFTLLLFRMLNIKSEALKGLSDIENKVLFGCYNDWMLIRRPDIVNIDDTQTTLELSGLATRTGSIIPSIRLQMENRG